MVEATQRSAARKGATFGGLDGGRRKWRESKMARTSGDVIWTGVTQDARRSFFVSTKRDHDGDGFPTPRASAVRAILRLLYGASAADISEVAGIASFSR